MVLIHLADGSYPLLIHVFQLSVEFFHILKIRSDGLVEQLIAKDYRLIFVTVRYFAPDVAVQLLAGFTVKQPRIAITVINIVTRLTAGSIVHIEDEIQVGFTAPVYKAIHTGKSVLIDRQSHIVLVCKQFVMERKANGIGSRTLDETDILTGHVIILECFPEFGSKVRSHQLAEHLVDETSRIGLVELEHITFRIQPVAQVGSHNEKLRAVRFYQVRSLNGYKGSGRHLFLCFLLATSHHAQ